MKLYRTPETSEPSTLIISSTTNKASIINDINYNFEIYVSKSKF